MPAVLHHTTFVSGQTPQSDRWPWSPVRTGDSGAS
jgi:hypothetical protein